MNRNLVPATITDKNGRVTTVYRKPDTASSAATKIPAVSLPQSSADDTLEKRRKVMETAKGAIEQRRLKKERLGYGVGEKDVIIDRLLTVYKKPDHPYILQANRNNHYAESFRAMERLVIRKPFQKDFAAEALRRYETINGDTFRNWATLGDRHYDAITASPIADEKTTAYLPGLLSAGIHQNAMQRHETGQPMSEQQEYNYLMLNLAARESRLEGTKIRQGSGYGLITCLDNKELTEFAMDCTDTEKLHRVCGVIKNRQVTRLSEALAIADGDTIGTLSNGAL